MVTQLVNQDSKPCSSSRVPALNHCGTGSLSCPSSSQRMRHLIYKVWDAAFRTDCVLLREPSQEGSGNKA